MMTNKSWWLVIAVVAAAPMTSHGNPNPSVPTGVFTIKSILGVNPSKDQIRIGESSNWRMAFGKCPESNHQPPLRVGDPRMTIAKEKQGPSGALVDVTTMETDFECGSCGGETCPTNQYCVEIASGSDVKKSCQLKLPAEPTLTCSAPVDQHVRCTAHH